jgi:hypothetical protein
MSASGEILFETIDWQRPELHSALVGLFFSLCGLEFDESELERRETWEHLVATRDEKYPYRLAFIIAYRSEPVPPPADGSDGAAAASSSPAQATPAAVTAAPGADATVAKAALSVVTVSKTSPPLVQTVVGGARLTIMGGAQLEYYRACNCGLMPYVVVGEVARGTGLSRRLVENGFAFLNSISADPARGVAELFIEVSQLRAATDDGNPYHSREAAAMRHRVWERIGFVGLDITFFHPGYLRNSPHQLAVFRPLSAGGATARDDATAATAESTRLRPVPRATVAAFLRGLFYGILVQEGQEAETDAEIAKQAPVMFGERDVIPAGAWL